MTIGFIGLGNMAKAIISGMLAKEVVKPSMLSGSARTKETREAVQKKYGIAVYEENRQVAREADILVLAVKPQMMETVIGEIRGDIKPDAVVVSIAAGKSLAWIENAFGKSIKLVRCMPNTPAMSWQAAAACAGMKGSRKRIWHFVWKCLKVSALRKKSRKS